MNRALAWKEWREQRSVVVGGTVTAVTLPLFVMAGMKVVGGRPLDTTSLADILLGLFAGILWPMFAIAAGAATFAHEAGDGTLAYLFSSPVSRLRIWGVKIMVAAAGALAVVLVSLGVAWAAGRMAGTTGVLAQIEPIARSGGPFVLSFAFVLLLLFSMSVLFSTLMTRSLTAAAGGLAASLGLMGALAGFWWRLDVAPRLEPGLLSLQLLMVSLASLAASWIVVRNEDVPRGPSLRDAARSALIVSGATVAAVALVVVPLNHLAPRNTTMGHAIPTPSGDALAMTAAARDGYSPRIWLVHADGSGVEPLTPRLSFSPMVSPDGRWVAYVSMQGPLGLRSRVGRLRAVRVDGSEDRLLADDLPLSLLEHIDLPVFSQDSSRVAVLSGGSLVAASIHDGELWRKGTDPRAALLGWTPDGQELLVLEAGRLLAMHVGARKQRLLREGVEMKTPFWWQPPAGIAAVPLKCEGRWGMVDTATGEARPLEAQVCGGFDQSADGTLAMADCRAGEVDVRVGEEVWGSYPGRSARLSLAPSADRIAVQVMEGHGRVGPVRVLGASGALSTFEPGWSVLGWSGRNRVLLMFEGADRRLALGDASTGELSVFFP